MNNEQEQQHTEAFRKRMQSVGANPQLTRLDPSGTVRLALADFSPFEGEYDKNPYLVLNMCVGHIGRIRRVGDGQQLEGVLRPGTFGIALPNSQAEGYWTKTKMLAIGVDLQQLNTSTENKSFSADDFAASASTLHNDPLITAVMTAMWRDAEAHGLSSAFFEHGLQLVLERLANYQAKPNLPRPTRALTEYQLSHVIGLMESRLSSNIQLFELASAIGQDKSYFSKAFRAATGYAPYEYFTLMRMKRAKLLLRTNTSITQVALNLGYTNPSKFAAAFRKVYGYSPSQWKRAL